MTLQAAGLPMSDAELVPTSAISEHALLVGYTRVAAPAAVVADCACGGQIVAISESPADVQLAIDAHQRMTIHVAWRIRVGIAPPVRPR